MPTPCSPPEILYLCAIAVMLTCALWILRLPDITGYTVVSKCMLQVLRQFAPAIAAKLATSMQHRQHCLQCRLAGRRVHVCWDPSPIICYFHPAAGKVQHYLCQAGITISRTLQT
jgi:hypothetical protein